MILEQLGLDVNGLNHKVKIHSKFPEVVNNLPLLAHTANIIVPNVPHLRSLLSVCLPPANVPMREEGKAYVF